MNLSGVFFLLVLLLFKCLQLVHAVLLLKVCRKVILPPTGVIAQLTLKGLVISVEIHVVTQSLPVSIFMTANLTLMRLCVGVTSLMSRHCRRRVCREATCVAHERTLVCMFESHVFVQGSLFHSSITAVSTMEPHCSLLCVFPQHVILQHVLRYAFEFTKLA